MKKIKVFLGGYTNYTNAQNLNCRALAEHLNKGEFEIYTLGLYNGNLSNLNAVGIHVFKCFRPVRISQYLAFFWGIWKADVVYLPKKDLWKFNAFLVKLFNKKSFSTVESIVDEEALVNLVSAFKTLPNFLKYRSGFNKLYSITTFMQIYNEKKLGIKTDQTILKVGINVQTFTTLIAKNSLSKVIMIGNDLVRKGIYDYFEIAARFPEILFYVAGSGNGNINVVHEIKKLQLNNVVYKGGVTTDQLVNLLKEVDLHILPSHSEGFGLVTLEAAAAGIPSIVYDDYGAEGWIKNGKNGWVVKNIHEMISVVDELRINQGNLRAVSVEAVKLAQSFDWKVLIKDWEKEIAQLAANGSNLANH